MRKSIFFLTILLSILQMWNTAHSSPAEDAIKGNISKINQQANENAKWQADLAEKNAKHEMYKIFNDENNYSTYLKQKTGLCSQSMSCPPNIYFNLSGKDKINLEEELEWKRKNGGG